MSSPSSRRCPEPAVYRIRVLKGPYLRVCPRHLQRAIELRVVDTVELLSRRKQFHLRHAFIAAVFLSYVAALIGAIFRRFLL